CLFLHATYHHLYHHSLPTRRSSDLAPSAHRPAQRVSTISGADQGDVHKLQGVQRQVHLPLRVPQMEPPHLQFAAKDLAAQHGRGDRKSTRLNSSHVKISYAVFCLKK